MNERKDSGIVEIPSKRLKPVKKFELYPEDEREAYFDFMHWALTREHQVILDLPKHEDDFFIQLDEFGNDVSAFNTIDYKRLHSYNKYGYKLRMVFRKVKDLAETYSCLSNEDGKRNIHQRFLNLIDNEFRDHGKFLLKTFNKYPEFINKRKLFDKIEEINNNVVKCKTIWNQFAFND